MKKLNTRKRNTSRHDTQTFHCQVTCVNVADSGSAELAMMPGSIQPLEPALTRTSSTVDELTRLAT